MNAQQAENLRILIRHMEKNVKRTLGMQADFLPCGTRSCAIGEATTIPALIAAGLPSKPGVAVGGHFRNHKAVFEMSDQQLARLFGVANYNAWGRDSVTPQEWAVEARKVLAEHGYSMEPDNPPVMDAFARFKSRVLEPVEL